MATVVSLFAFGTLGSIGCSTHEMEKHARNPNDPHAEAEDSDRCCGKWEGTKCVDEKIRGCSTKVTNESTQHGLEFPTPQTVKPGNAPTQVPISRPGEIPTR